MGRVDEILGRLAQSRAEQYLQQVARRAAEQRGTVPVDILLRGEAVDSLRRVDDLLARNGMEVQGGLGWGAESAVLDLGDKVLKVGPMDRIYNGPAAPFSAPDARGVAPYLLSELIGPYRVGVQPKAIHVRPDAADVRHYGTPVFDQALHEHWNSGADILRKSLREQGLDWEDPHGGNLGIFQDGEMAVIDGEVRPLPAPRPKASPEETIRAIRSWDWRPR